VNLISQDNVPIANTAPPGNCNRILGMNWSKALGIKSGIWY